MSSLVILRIMNVMKQLSSPLTNEDNIKATNLFKLVAQSSMGPKGCLKMLQNTCGGLVTITSSSHRLLTVLKFSNPYNRLVAAALVNHLKLYDNDGLYLIFLTLEQLNRSMKLGIQPSLISAVCQKLQHSLVNHLETCSLKLQVNFDNLDLLLALTKSILTSKPACGLNEKQRNHLAYLLLRYFLNSVPQSESIDEKVGTFHFITESGLSLDHCQLFEGLLIEVYDAKNIQTVSGLQKCALFHISLSGDVETSLSDEKWTIHDNFNIVDSCTKHVMEICAQVVSEGVSLVACQKVIHPRAKKYLTNYGIIVLDRLGQLSFQALQELTDASPIESFVSTLDSSCLGVLDHISLQLLNKKYYYHLQKRGSPISTFYLTNYNEESVSELKVVCRQAINALRSLLSSPSVFCGGGCLETHLAAFVRSWSTDNMQELLRTGVNMGQATAITEAFAASFESIAMHLSNQERLIVGQDCYHCWQARDNFEGKTNVVKCGCGLLTKTSMLSEGESVNPLQNGDVNSSLILDAALSKRESIKTSIQTFLTMLQIDWIMSK